MGYKLTYKKALIENILSTPSPIIEFIPDELEFDQDENLSDDYRFNEELSELY